MFCVNPKKEEEKRDYICDIFVGFFFAELVGDIVDLCNIICIGKQYIQLSFFFCSCEVFRWLISPGKLWYYAEKLIIKYEVFDL